MEKKVLNCAFQYYDNDDDDFVPLHILHVTAGVCIALIFSINLLRLPEYPRQSVLEDRLLTALRCGSQGYGLV